MRFALLALALSGCFVDGEPFDVDERCFDVEVYVTVVRDTVVADSVTNNDCSESVALTFIAEEGS